MRQIAIDGCGVAGLTAASLLFQRGMRVSLRAEKRATPHPMIVAVPQDSLTLLQEIWLLPELTLNFGRRLARRRVAWETETFESLDATTTVFDPRDLAAALFDELPRGVKAAPSQGANEFVVIARGRSASETETVIAGARQAVVGRMDEARLFDRDAISIASTSVGWLFASPSPHGDAAVMLVRPGERQCRDQAEDLNHATHRIFGADAAVECVVGCQPNFTYPIGEGRLRIGDATVAMDPLRGDGVGNAVRSALLAQACIGAGLTPHALEHFVARQALLFVRHVKQTIDHYARCRHASIWRGEIEMMRQAIGLVVPLIRPAALRFTLCGRNLVASHPNGRSESQKGSSQKSSQNPESGGDAKLRS
ncbi:hypothetical protein IYY11_02555 [Methylocystis sp. H62]|uniref:hypothetical protein n=1 Tax=Methylocystis sp. H62 TaxID=2785789 RepID=UPI0018C2397D|nr:hypothetical protein [Methylocystis sp. H62]MBG0792339.1 hypothetical protein [Methylocystis sp. H62]